MSMFKIQQIYEKTGYVETVMLLNYTSSLILNFFDIQEKRIQRFTPRLHETKLYKSSLKANLPTKEKT